MCVGKNARKFWKNRNSLPENSSLGNFQNMVMCMTGKMQKGAREFLPLRLALYHIFGQLSSLNFPIYPIHSIVHAPRFTHTCTVGAMNPKTRARICDSVTSVFALSDGFPVHCISSFLFLVIIYYHELICLSIGFSNFSCLICAHISSLFHPLIF